MSADPSRQAGDRPVGSPGAPGEPSEEELRAAYEAELDRVTSADMMLQAAVSLVNIGGRRLGLGGAPGGAPAATGQDLGQVRDAIDGVRALLEILERTRPQELKPLRDALSQLQMAYAREAQTATATPAATGADSPARPPAEGPPAAGAEEAKPAGGDPPGADEKPSGPGPAQSSGRLWVPGS